MHVCVCVVARRQGLGAHMASKDRVGGDMEESSHLPHLDAPWRHACLPSAGCPFESATDGGGPTRACGLGTLTRREGDSKAGRQAGGRLDRGRMGGRERVRALEGARRGPAWGRGEAYPVCRQGTRERACRGDMPVPLAGVACLLPLAPPPFPPKPRFQTLLELIKSF